MADFQKGQLTYLKLTIDKLFGVRDQGPESPFYLLNME